jgi:murein DD-endopeptidase MepM/ murein hydrolase activator NlpD
VQLQAVLLVALGLTIGSSDPALSPSSSETGPAFGPEMPPEGPFALEVPIRHSLEASLSAAVGPSLGSPLAQVTKRILVWWLDLRRDLRAGDQLRLVYRTPWDAEPVVEAVWLRSGKLREERQAIRFHAAGAPFPRYFDREGRALEPEFVHPPIQSYEQVTSLLGDGRGHKGVDFKAPVGTPIKAPFDGRVVRRNWATRRNGRCIELEADDMKVRALFLHLADVHVRAGQRVRRGDQLGTSGNTGHSTAPHLHYQLERADGRILDPFRFHPTRRGRLAADQRTSFERRWRNLEAMSARSGEEG